VIIENCEDKFFNLIFKISNDLKTILKSSNKTAIYIENQNEVEAKNCQIEKKELQNQLNFIQELQNKLEMQRNTTIEGLKMELNLIMVVNKQLFIELLKKTADGIDKDEEIRQLNRKIEILNPTQSEMF
jgi:hypothetical protein